MRHSRKKNGASQHGTALADFCFADGVALLLANCDRVKVAAEQFGGELAAPQRWCLRRKPRTFSRRRDSPSRGRWNCRCRTLNCPNGCEVTSLAMVLTAWGIRRTR